MDKDNWPTQNKNSLADFTCLFNSGDNWWIKRLSLSSRNNRILSCPIILKLLKSELHLPDFK